MSVMTTLILGAALMLALVVLKSRFVGFRTQAPADLAAKGPVFDLRTHLNGPIICEGVIFGPFGRVSSRFVADMEGIWNGDTGVLKERFVYDTGVVQHRQWTLHLGPEGHIRAEAPDVIGDGIGRAAGPGVLLKYRIKLDASAGGHVLNVTDWMYLMENGTIINRSQFTKFGITVAELVATFRKDPDRKATI